MVSFGFAERELHTMPTRRGSRPQRMRLQSGLPVGRVRPALGGETFGAVTIGADDVDIHPMAIPRGAAGELRPSGDHDTLLAGPLVWIWRICLPDAVMIEIPRPSATASVRPARAQARSEAAGSGNVLTVAVARSMTPTLPSDRLPECLRRRRVIGHREPRRRRGHREPRPDGDLSRPGRRCRCPAWHTRRCPP